MLFYPAAAAAEAEFEFYFLGVNVVVISFVGANCVVSSISFVRPNAAD